ncbi:MAG: PA14 domain-containing protein [Opitutaceae bacterium]|jgi:hypothetical protein
MPDFKTKVVRYLKRAGAGSMLISIIVHVFIIVGATVYVVSSVQPQRKALFKGGDGGTSEIRRPVKMSNTQPKLDTLTKRLSVDTPNAAVSLPDLPSNPDSGLGGPQLNSGPASSGSGAGTSLKAPIMPAFGFKEARPGGTLVGRLYDLKQFRTRKPNPDLEKLGPGRLALTETANFVRSGWNSRSLSEFFQAPTVLYATQIFVPMMPAAEAPKAYGVEKTIQPNAWIAHYKGKVSPPATGAYRFVGTGDDFLAVRIDGRLVLDAGGGKVSNFKTDRPQSPAYSYNYSQGPWIIKHRGGVVVGNRVELRAGLFYDLDIVFSEGPGGAFCAMLLFEQEGVSYEKDAKGNPLLPVFRVADSKVEQTQNTLPFMPDGPIWKALPPPK